MSLLKFLGLAPQKTETTTDSDVASIRKISRQLEELDPERARYIAAFAYLLGRVAHADLQISKEETEKMEEIVMERADLPRDQAVLVVEIAKQQNRLFGHVENFLVAREFNQRANKEQKLQLMECLFAVSCSDASISAAEDTEIRQIASELLVEHREFIGVRSKYRNYLAVLKQDGEKGEGKE